MSVSDSVDGGGALSIATSILCGTPFIRLLAVRAGMQLGLMSR